MNAAAAAAAEVGLEPATVTIRSTLLGTLRLPRAQLFDFPLGLFGFPDARGFALVPTTRPGVFWLQSANHAALTFLLADPFRFVEGYAVELGEAELGALAAASAAELIVLCVLTLPGGDRADPTLNLQGPVALNLARGEGRQVVLGDPGLGTRHPIRLDGVRGD